MTLADRWRRFAQSAQAPWIRAASIALFLTAEAWRRANGR